MKLKHILFTLSIASVFVSCDTVAPNFYGVLMENYGKNGKSDYSPQQGRVWTIGPGTELYQVPAYEQRGNFVSDQNKEGKTSCKSADGSEFTIKPRYSYQVIKDKVVDVVFANSRYSEGEFLPAVEDNVLEPRMYDLIKEESRRWMTDTLMSPGGSLRFEQRCEKIIRSSFEAAGFELLSFSVNLDFSDNVKTKIDKRNETNTNISVIDQQILEQKKANELEALKTEQLLIKSKGLTPEILKQEFIERWDGKTPLYGNTPVTLFKQTN